MAAPCDCDEIDQWQAMPEDAVPDDLRQRCEQHLEACPACQQRLDRSTDVPPSLRQVLQNVGDPTATPFDSTLIQVMDRLCEAKAPVRVAADESIDLYFLRSAECPDVLGLLDNYEVLEVIGQGGMGLVLKAYEPALHRFVAIKVLAPALAGSASARQRFTREAQAAAAVSHEHVVVVHGVHETSGLPYLVMEYVAGESLQDRLDRTGPLELIEIVRIGYQTAAGLAAAHAQGMMHRDIKPANLLLENGLARVTITDFGLARAVDDVQLTQQGMVAGTPEYMSPEQAQGDLVDPRSDLFSLGSVLYAMATGSPPFRGSTAMAVLRHVSEQTPPPVRSLNPNVSAWLEQFIQRLMAKAPEQRIQTAAAVAGLLEGYLAHLQQPATIAPPEIPRAERSGRAAARGWRWFLFAGPVLVLLVGLGLALWLGAGGSGTPAAVEEKEYSESFRGKPATMDGLRLDGPDASKYVHFEPEGLRVTLPAGEAGGRAATGFTLVRRITGDFEITVRFDLLRESPGTLDASSLGTRPLTRFEIDVGVDREKKNVVALSRQWDAKEGRRFFAWKSLLNETTGNYEKQARTLLTRALTGRLRLTRTGNVIRYYVAEGTAEQFTLVSQSPFTGQDVSDVRFIASTNNREAALDVRISDLNVRAQALGRPGMAGPERLPPALPSSAAEGATVFLPICLALALVLILSLAVWQFVRRRRLVSPLSDHRTVAPERMAEAIAFRCSACDKTLKTRPQLAGKKVKCPGCGQATCVPEVPAVAEPLPQTARRRWRPRPWVLGSLAAFLLVGLAAWLLWPAPADPASLLNVTLGNTFINGVKESGFYEQEQDQHGQAFRWTDGHARLVIPIDKETPPRSLFVEIYAFRPPGTAAHLQILANQRELTNEDMHHWRFRKTFPLKDIELGESLVLEIRSDTFQPQGIMDGGANRDPRTLGIQVRSVRLSTTLEDSAPAASGR